MKAIYFILIYCTIKSVSARGHGHSGHSTGHSSYGHSGAHHRSHSHVSTSHTHYTYHPPHHITYVCRYCSSATTYPVYKEMPPSYVYVYRESDSRFGNILSGLALYNLGRSSSDWDRRHYRSRPDEKCSMQVIEKGYFEETEIPCFMISSFIDVDDNTRDTHIVDISSSHNNVKPFIKSEGPALEVKNQECVLWHNLTSQKEMSHVPCGLLKQYSDTVKPSGVPVYIWLPTLLGIVIIIYTCCYCVRKQKKETVKEEFPLYETRPVKYCTEY